MSFSFNPVSWTQRLFGTQPVVANEPGFIAEEPQTRSTSFLTVARVAAGVFSLIAAAGSSIAFLASGNPIAAAGIILFGFGALILLDTSQSSSRAFRTHHIFTTINNPPPRSTYNQTTYQPPSVVTNPFGNPFVSTNTSEERINIGRHDTVPQGRNQTITAMPVFGQQPNQDPNQRVQVGSHTTATQPQAQPFYRSTNPQTTSEVRAVIGSHTPVTQSYQYQTPQSFTSSNPVQLPRNEDERRVIIGDQQEASTSNNDNDPNARVQIKKKK